MIRSIIHRQLGRNMFGIFNFFNKQVSEQHKNQQVLQIQYQNAQNVSQRLDIMKNIINLIQDQEYPSLDTLDNYFKFIVDYKKCIRLRLDMDMETAQAYQQILQKFLDPITFDKVQERVFKDSSLIKFDFLKLNQLAIKFETAIDEEEYDNIKQILNDMVDIVVKQQWEDTLPNQLMLVVSSFHKFYFHFLVDEMKYAEINLLELLNEVDYYCNQNNFTQNEDFIEEDQLREFLFSYKIRILKSLIFIYFDLKQSESCIKYQNQALQLIKDYEGISKYYLKQVQQFHVHFSQLNYYRSLQVLEETCSQLERKEDKFVLHLQRMETLYFLNQVSKNDIKQLLRLQAEINLKDTNAETMFYALMLLCSARFQEYTECQKYIDIMTHQYEVGTQSVTQLMECIHSLYVELTMNKDNPNLIRAYKDIIAYSEIKTSPVYQEVKRRFTEHFFEHSKNEQYQMVGDMKSVLEYQLYKGIFEDDQNLIRDTLEQTFKLFQINPNYKNTLLRIFALLRKSPKMTAQVIAQLNGYICLLAEEQII